MSARRNTAHRHPVIHHNAASVPRVGIPVPPVQAGKVGMGKVICCVAPAQGGVVIVHIARHVSQHGNVCRLHQCCIRQGLAWKENKALPDLAADSAVP